VVGIQCEAGKKTASRLDPLAIGSGVPLYEGAADGDWVVDAADAKTSKGKPVKYKKDGKASEANHSNIAPSIDELAGGVTIDRAEQTWVFSLAGVRRLRFPTRTDGERHATPAARRDAERSARTALIALALTAAACARVDGYDFRSRCVLTADGPMQFEVLDADGGPPVIHTLTAAEARGLLTQAVDQATQAGMRWNVEPILLEPMPRLVSLVQLSRKLGDEAQADA
jgi:CRISPR-associated protein Csb1